MEPMTPEFKMGRNTGISRQILVLLLAFTIFPMVALTGILYFIDSVTHRKEILRGQQAIAGRVAQLVELHVKASLNSLDLLTLSQDLRSGKQSEIQRIFSDFLYLESEFDALALIGLDGYPISRYSRLHTYREPEREWSGRDPGFLNARQGHPNIGDVRISEFGLFPTLQIHVPVIDNGKTVEAVIRADLNISRMWRLVAKAFNDENMTVYIVDPNGILIAADDLSLVFERKNLLETAQFPEFRAGGSQVFEQVGIKGAPVVGVIVANPLTGWGVVVETPISVAFYHLKLLWWIFGTVTLFTGAVAGVFGWFFSHRKILQPIRKLQEDVRVIATGDLDHRIVVNRSDELGKLAVDLSTMVVNLKSLTVSRELLVQENLERQKTETALREKERRLTDILDFFPNATLAIDNDRRLIIWNKAIEAMTGIPAREIIGKGDYIYTIPFYGERRPQLMDLIWEADSDVAVRYPGVRREGNSYIAEVFCPTLYNGRGAWIYAKASPLHTPQGEIIGAIESLQDITDYKRTQEALEHRIVALTRPLDAAEGIEFDELFNLEEIQKMQDQFAEAVGVASMITRPDGIPVTRPSKFCRLCKDIIRKTEKGLENCYASDAALGKKNPDGPSVEPCSSCGLWDAGASITVGGRHIANWLVGQVRNEAQDEDKIRAYAHEIGADESAFLEAYREVPSMSMAQFEKIAQALFTLAGQLSSMAYQNVQQARFISEAKRAALEKQRLQDQLVQAQKMESVGRLAGGVAHDFNNMLQVIQGYTDLSLEDTLADSPLHGYLLEIQRAAKHSTDLVQQLLTFARKQIICPKVLDLNEAVSSSMTMLRRLIGENIDLAWVPGDGPWHVRIDPSQVRQLLTNLAVNARDAIAGATGRITISTEARRIMGETDCLDRPGCVPGDYVLLSVRDNGRGMDPETVNHIFEPFYTTKGLGAGTGLGLSMVYGIVEQNQGFITVRSAPGEGTCFDIFLPTHVPEAIPIPETPAPMIISKGAETLLIVEDDPAILDLGRTMLVQLGYTVLAADTPELAISIAETHPEPIDLLITDVVMPRMNGRDLYHRLIELRPDLKCLFMSGYTDDVIANQGILEQGVHLLHKPFSITELADKAREVLADPACRPHPTGASIPERVSPETPESRLGHPRPYCS